MRDPAAQESEAEGIIPAAPTHAPAPGSRGPSADGRWPSGLRTAVHQDRDHARRAVGSWGLGGGGAAPKSGTPPYSVAHHYPYTPGTPNRPRNAVESNAAYPSSPISHKDPSRTGLTRRNALVFVVQKGPIRDITEHRPSIERSFKSKQRIAASRPSAHPFPA